MKTLAELKEMHFIPHHSCGLCGNFVGWYTNEPHPYFDPSCGCGCSDGHYETWEDVFKWYNKVFEHESEEAVQSAWEKETIDVKNIKCIYMNTQHSVNKQVILNIVENLLHQKNFISRDQFEIMIDRINACGHRLDFVSKHLRDIEQHPAIRNAIKDHKSNWVADSKGGEPNHY